MIRIVVPDVNAMNFAEDFLAGEKAVTRAMAGAAMELKALWRGQVTAAGLGQRLANTIRVEHYPKGTDSMNAALLGYTKAPKLIAAHNNGVLISAKGGRYLAIPTQEAGVLRNGGRISPDEWQRRRGRGLRFVHRRGRPSLLVADNARLNKRGWAVGKGGRRRRDGILSGEQTVPIFVLVPQVRLPKRMSLEQSVSQVAGSLAGRISRNWYT